MAKQISNYEKKWNEQVKWKLRIHAMRLEMMDHKKKLVEHREKFRSLAQKVANEEREFIDKFQ